MANENQTTEPTPSPGATCSPSLIEMPVADITYKGTADYLSRKLRTSEKHVVAARKQRDAALKSLGELHAALVRYEADVDSESPTEHRRMMERAAALLPEND
jgi:hypothetical protein